MNYTTEQFNFSVDEYGRTLTGQSHQTLYWLNRQGYLNNDQTEDLLSRMVVVPIRNNKSFGQRLLERFFNKKSEENSYVFPITLLEDVCNADTNDINGKPKLTVIK
jgi:hypothetical protein